MAAQTILFVGDELHFSNSAASVTVSSTENGYNKESVRDTSWNEAWKPDDGSSNEWIKIDGGSQTWLGSVGQDMYFAVAYDARGSGQSSLYLRWDAADDPNFTSIQNEHIFTVNTTGPTCDYCKVTLSDTTQAGADTPPRYWRLDQLVADRTGTTTIKIYAVAFFKDTSTYILDTEYPQVSPGPGAYDFLSRVGVAESAGGMDWTNVNGTPFQEFDLNLDRAPVALWQALRTQFLSWHQGVARKFWMQYEGIYTDALANFGMVGFASAGYGTIRVLKDKYDTNLRFRTAPKPL